MLFVYRDVLRTPCEGDRRRALRDVTLGEHSKRIFHTVAGDPSWHVRTAVAEKLIGEWKASREPVDCTVRAAMKQLLELINAPEPLLLPHDIRLVGDQATEPRAAEIKIDPEVEIVNIRGVGLRILQLVFDPEQRCGHERYLGSEFQKKLAQRLIDAGFLEAIDLRAITLSTLTPIILSNLRNPAGVVSAADIAAHDQLAPALRWLVLFSAATSLVFLTEHSEKSLEKLPDLAPDLRALKERLTTHDLPAMQRSYLRWGEITAVKDNRQMEAYGILRSLKCVAEFIATAHEDSELRRRSLEIAERLLAVMGDVAPRS